MILSSMLSFLFGIMIIYSVISFQQKFLKYIALSIYLGGIFFVWNPDKTTAIANYFGIGRGLDFVLILFLVAIINGALVLLKYLNSLHKNITKVVRHIAILEARTPLN